LNLRKIFLASAVLLVTVLPSCQSTNRAGKDLFITAASPFVILYGGFTDGYVAGQNIDSGSGGGTIVSFITYPFTITYHLIRHTFMVTHYALDFVGFPIYGAAELHPNGPEIMPLDYYTGTWFDENAEAWAKEKSEHSGTDAETGAKVESEE